MLLHVHEARQNVRGMYPIALCESAKKRARTHTNMVCIGPAGRYRRLICSDLPPRVLRSRRTPWCCRVSGNRNCTRFAPNLECASERLCTREAPLSGIDIACMHACGSVKRIQVHGKCCVYALCVLSNVSEHLRTS